MEEKRLVTTRKPRETPIWEKALLTIDEANAYSGIGRNKLLELTERRGCKIAVWDGRTRLIKREKLDEFIDSAYSI